MGDAKGGWIHIEEYHDFSDSEAAFDAISRPAGVPPFKPGWVWGKLLSVDSNEAPRKFYAAPSESSRVVQEKYGMNLKIRDCKDRWLKVLDSETNVEGWLPIGSYCGNPVTTC